MNRSALVSRLGGCVLFACALAASSVASAQTTVLIEDNFNRTGLLFGSSPSGGTLSVDWGGSNNAGLSANGSALAVGVGVRAGFLSLPLVADTGVYTFSVTASVTSRVNDTYPPDGVFGATGALMFGFTNSLAATEGNSASGTYVAGLNYRNDGRYVVWDNGTATSIVTGLADGTAAVTFTIIIDTNSRVDNVSFTDSLNKMSHKMSLTAEEINSITGIKLGVNTATGFYDNLSVTHQIPEASSSVILFGVGAIALVLCLRRRNK